MNGKEIFIDCLINDYNETRKRWKSLEEEVNDIRFNENYTEEEQLMLLKEFHALEDYLGAKKKRVRYMIAKANEATHHCGQDADMDDACCQVRSGRVDHAAAPAAVKELPDSIAQLVGMQIVSAFRPGWKCEECAFSHIDFARCEKKVELVGGYYLCLAPIPIVTE